MSSLIKSITELAGPAVIGAVAGKLGESESGVSKAIGAFIPAILSGMVEKVGSEGGLESLFAALSAPETGSFLDDLGGLVGGGNIAQGDPRDVAGALMGSLFGDKVGGILGAVVGLAGFGDKSAAGGILGLVGPMVMGFLGKKIAAEGLGALGLKKLLLGEKDEIFAAVPPAIAGLIGVTPAVGAATASVAGASAGTSVVAASTAPAATGSVGFLKWVLPVLAIGALGWYLLRGDKPVSPPAETYSVEAHGGEMHAADDVAAEEASAGHAAHADMAAEEIVAEAATAHEGTEAVDAENAEDAVADVVTETTVDLASVVPGLDLTQFADGVEGKLVRFIESDKAPCTTADCWFTMDRLTFESGSADLNIERSSDQLEKINAIMAAYPSLQLKFGGYTDNTGDVDFNLNLSQNRAETVVAALVDLGVDSARMSAEGYGIEFPVASNDTPEGRAQNRRIDVRVKQR